MTAKEPEPEKTITGGISFTAADPDALIQNSVFKAAVTTAIADIANVQEDHIEVVLSIIRRLSAALAEVRRRLSTGIEARYTIRVPAGSGSSSAGGIEASMAAADTTAFTAAMKTALEAAGQDWSAMSALFTVSDVSAPTVDSLFDHDDSRQQDESGFGLLHVAGIIAAGGALVGILGFLWHRRQSGRSKGARDQEVRVIEPAVGVVIGGQGPHGNTNNQADGVPTYWSGNAIPPQGWRLEAVRDEKTIGLLTGMLVVRDPEALGTGQDCQHYGRNYKGGALEFYCAWRVENPIQYDVYRATMKKIVHQVEFCKAQLPEDSLAPSNVLLQGGLEMPGSLNGGANEQFLLSGTKPQFLVDILNQGLNEKLASTGGLFGPAIYLAEEACKMDQYTTPDHTYEDFDLEPMHSTFFGVDTHKHPCHNKSGDEQDLFYCLVVRTVLGWHCRTLDGSTNVDVAGQPCWVDPGVKRELAVIEGTSPALRYHSLIALAGPKARIKRFRELMVYSGSQCYIEYVLAYRRISRK